MHLWRSEIDLAYLYHFSPLLFETRTSLNLEAPILVSLSDQRPQDPLVFVSPVMESLACATLLSFHMGAERLNLGVQVYAENTLPME